MCRKGKQAGRQTDRQAGRQTHHSYVPAADKQQQHRQTATSVSALCTAHLIAAQSAICVRTLRHARKLFAVAAVLPDPRAFKIHNLTNGGHRGNQGLKVSAHHCAGMDGSSQLGFIACRFHLPWCANQPAATVSPCAEHCLRPEQTLCLPLVPAAWQPEPLMCAADGGVLPSLDAVATCRAWIASNAAPDSIPVYTWLLQDVQPRLRRAYAAGPHMPRAAMARSAANPGQTLRAPRKSGGVPHLAHVWELLLGYYVPELLAGGCARG